MSKRWFFLIPVLLLVNKTFGQYSALDKQVSISVDNQPLEVVLDLLEEQSGVTFSYPGNLIPEGEKTSLHLEQKSLRYALDETLGSEVRYLERGSFVILQAKKKSTSKQKFKVSGELVDASTGNKIANASIYEVNSLKSTTSSKDGSYAFEFTDKSDYVDVAIAKEHYRDTVLHVRRSELSNLVIELEPIPSAPDLQNDVSAADSSTLAMALINKNTGYHMSNVHLVEHKLGQVSFLPSLGTNKRMSGKTTNNLSLNILAGYSYATMGLEVGGFANIVRRNMYGMQFAGFSNIVGGKTRGLQVAGFVNVNKLNLIGLQFAGFTNTVANEVDGGQFAGFLNVAATVDGAQFAGFVNTVWSDSKANQFAGFVNFCKNNSGSQWAGFVNTAPGVMKGLQAAGFANYGRKVHGVQMAIVTNIASKEMHGVQMSSLLNYTKTLHGVQMGLINICDSVAGGFNVGLINIVRKGIHDLELHYSESMHANLLFKTGTRRLYSIIAFGYRLDMPLWSAGYGFGTRKDFKNGLRIGWETQVSSIHEREDPKRYINLLGQAYPFIGFNIADELAITTGPVYNAYYSRHFNAQRGEFGYPILINPFYDVTEPGQNLKMSIGYRVALSF